MRRLFHLISGLLLVLIVAYLDRRGGLIFISSLFLIVIIIETVRFSLPHINTIFFYRLGPLLRGGEKNRPTGAVYYLGGTLLALLLFEYEIALFSMTILAVGDPTASFAGKRFGMHPSPLRGEGRGEGRGRGKSIEGAVGFFIVSIGAGLIFHGLWSSLSVVIMITGVIAGTLAEFISNRVDDNLLIPIAASGAMGAISFFLKLVNLY